MPIFVVGVASLLLPSFSTSGPVKVIPGRKNIEQFRV